MPKARIEYEEDETSRLYRLKRWYNRNHWDVKRAIKNLTLFIMFLPAIYLVVAFLIILMYAYPIVVSIVAAFVLALIAISIKASD